MSAIVPRIVAHESFNGQTSDLSPAVTLTAPAAGTDYRVSLYATPVSGSPTGSVTIDFTDAAGSQELALGIGTASQKTSVIHAASSTSVSVSTTGTQSGGAFTYDLFVTIEEL